MIRLSEDVIAEVQMRGCAPLESFVFGIRLQMWPVFQKLMTENVDALKKMADGSGAGYFSRSANTTESQMANVSFPFMGSSIHGLCVLQICKRYIIIFNSFVALTDQAEETMIFSK